MQNLVKDNAIGVARLETPPLLHTIRLLLQKSARYLQRALIIILIGDLVSIAVTTGTQDDQLLSEHYLPNVLRIVVPLPLLMSIRFRRNSATFLDRLLIKFFVNGDRRPASLLYSEKLKLHVSCHY